MHTKIRTIDIIPNDNICFPIGTILAVNKLYDMLDLSTVFGKHKKNGIDINNLLNLVSYKLAEIESLIDWETFNPVLESMYNNRTVSGDRPEADVIVMFGLVNKHSYLLLGCIVLYELSQVQKPQS
ncbi:hypothetical protein [uncultured Methanomethylovorans sp.]|uniref:hypothetical protein n=1 Tax=uncultured Methanomethylovorans sp. TaxID=183759 RepID=UPI003747B250